MILHGLPEWEAAMTRLVLEMEVAEKKAVGQAALAQKKAVRANMTGALRWFHHHNSPRGGGPGEGTGHLLKSVSYKAVMKAGPGRYKTELKAKTNYAAKVEAKYPYFVPGVQSAEVGHIFYEHYRAVIR